MGTAIGASLPYAAAAALSPIPITAVTLILLARRGFASSLFVAGRLFSYAFVLTCVVIASDLIRPGTDAAPSELGVVLRIVLGAIALGAGIWTWVGRSSEGESTPTPWMRVTDRITPTRGAALGVALSAGPKSLLLLAGGGLALAGARVTWAGEAVAVLIFLAVAGSTVLVPVVLYYAFGARTLKGLRALQGWMQNDGAIISALLLILVGVVLIGSGIIGL